MAPVEARCISNADMLCKDNLITNEVCGSSSFIIPAGETADVYVIHPDEKTELSATVLSRFSGGYVKDEHGTPHRLEVNKFIDLHGVHYTGTGQHLPQNK